MEDMKTRSFRITDKVAEKIKEIAGEIGGNQQEALSKLIEAYEFQQGKAILTTKREDIDIFERYVTALSRMYMGVLEENQNVTELVRTEFDAALKSKDLVIQDLQKLNRELKENQEQGLLKMNRLTEENKQLQKILDTERKEVEQNKTSFDSMLADKEKLNMVLQNSLDEAKEKLKKLGNELGIVNEKMKNSEELQKKLSQLESQIKNMEIENEKKVFDLEKKYQADIQKLRELQQEEISNYQKQYFDLLSTVQVEPVKNTSAAPKKKVTKSKKEPVVSSSESPLNEK